MLSLTIAMEASNRSGTVLSNSRWIGDVVHGFLKSLCIDGGLNFFSPLSDGDAARPYTLRLLSPGLDHRLDFRLTLFGPHALAVNEFLSQLLAEPIELGPPSTIYRVSSISYALPGTNSIASQDEDSGIFEAIPQALLEAASLETHVPMEVSPDSFRLRFESPLRIGKQAEVVPTLHAIVKNIAQSLFVLEPTTAAALDLESAEWYQELRLLHKVMMQAEGGIQHWQYRSVNQAAHRRSGFLGALSVNNVDSSLISARVRKLLWLGQWLGVGQNTVGAQGAYNFEQGT